MDWKGFRIGHDVSSNGRMASPAYLSGYLPQNVSRVLVIFIAFKIN